MIGAITGVLASRSTQYEYFTSVLYPFVVDDVMSVSIPAHNSGNLWYIPEEVASVQVPTLVTGDLTPTIVYKTYNEPLALEVASVSVPTLVTGDLTPTIVYKTYNEPLALEAASVQVPTLITGDLVVTINYITYDNGEDDVASVSVPTLISGTLA